MVQVPDTPTDAFGAPASSRVVELQRVEIRIPQHKPQPDRLAGELADVRTRLPTHRVLQAVADDLRAVVELEAIERLARRCLQLNTQAAGRSPCPPKSGSTPRPTGRQPVP